MGMRLIVVMVASAFALSACGGSGGPARTPLIVDTDLSSDDAIALLYLAQEPRIDLRAVTVSGTGLVRCPTGGRIALDLLALAGRPDVPVACGADLPLAGFNSVPEDWRDAADNLFGLTLPRAERQARHDAVQVLADAVERSPSKPTVLELAPMTNLAAALKAHRDLARGLRRVVAMSGAIAVPGNAPEQPTAETNAWIDPTAADVVLRSGASITLVPLDATNQVPVTPTSARTLARYHRATPEATLASEIIASTGMGRGGSYFWDPLAAVAITRPELVTTEERRIATITGGPDAGRTAVASDGHPSRVVTGVDRLGFERVLLETLLGGSKFQIDPQPAQGTLTLETRGCRYRGARRLTAGEVTLGTVNRTAAPFQYVAGRLRQGHTLGDLKRYARTITATAQAPPWFTVDATGWIPPHSDMTWVADLPTGTSGETVLACTRPSPPRAWVAASLPVFARR